MGAGAKAPQRLVDLRRLEAIAVQLRLLVGPGSDRQEISAASDLLGRSRCDPRQRVVHLTGTDEIGGGVEHALQALSHRVQLGPRRPTVCGGSGSSAAVAARQTIR